MKFFFYINLSNPWWPRFLSTNTTCLDSKEGRRPKKIHNNFARTTKAHNLYTGRNAQEAAANSPIKNLQKNQNTNKHNTTVIIIPQFINNKTSSLTDHNTISYNIERFQRTNIQKTHRHTNSYESHIITNSRNRDQTQKNTKSINFSL